MGRPVVAPYRQIGLTAQASIRATCALVDETNHQLDKRVLTGLMRGYFHPCLLWNSKRPKPKWIWFPHLH